MKNTTKLLNSYIASLLVWNVKLHNIHWNVTGHLFKPVHEYTEALYDRAFDAYDDPSLSKYFLIANQEGTEKINGHPIPARKEKSNPRENPFQGDYG